MEEVYITQEIIEHDNLKSDNIASTNTNTEFLEAKKAILRRLKNEILNNSITSTESLQKIEVASVNQTLLAPELNEEKTNEIETLVHKLEISKKSIVESIPMNLDAEILKNNETAYSIQKMGDNSINQTSIPPELDEEKPNQIEPLIHKFEISDKSKQSNEESSKSIPKNLDTKILNKNVSSANSKQNEAEADNLTLIPPELEITFSESFKWLVNYDKSILSIDTLVSWLVVGEKVLTVNDETIFCDSKILCNFLEAKSKLDPLSDTSLYSARKRSNPFEAVGKSIFIDRAAVKLANLDAVLDFMFTYPVDKKYLPLVKDNELLYFADIGGGPGGFVDYMLWRKGWKAKGFGITPKDGFGYKFYRFCGENHSFQTYYGNQRDGDITNPENIKSFIGYVHSHTAYGVHIALADGAVPITRARITKEIISKQIHLCHCIVGLSILRTDGHFLLKLFDTFTPFTVGLIYLMYKCFQEIAIIKPKSSRPANSEKYLICKYKKSNTKTIVDHLSEINEAMIRQQESDLDISEIVSIEVMKKDKKFFNLICEINNTLTYNEIRAIETLYSYREFLVGDSRQASIREECLQRWHLPHEAKELPLDILAEDCIKRLLGTWYESKSFLDISDVILSKNSKLSDIFPVIRNWFFIPIEDTKQYRTYFMSKGSNNVLMYIDNTWINVPDINLMLPRNTFIYGEIVTEYSFKGTTELQISSLHIIDGLILGGVDIRNMTLSKRWTKCKQFATSINNPTTFIRDNTGKMKRIAPIYCKELKPLNHLHYFLQYINKNKKELSDKTEHLALNIKYPIGPHRFYLLNGLLFLCEKIPNILVANINRKDVGSKSLTANADISSFKSTISSRHIWKWENPNSDLDISYKNEKSDAIPYKSLHSLIY